VRSRRYSAVTIANRYDGGGVIATAGDRQGRRSAGIPCQREQAASSPSKR